ncbi:DUF4239 domain-containing protein [Streptomyces sp. NPDC053474]|uniref:bestrophin-like domain n=1 Tax=Streptomyces sp. NPDC053474 TaxID=3365704 RepID=UPI0037CF99B4
MGVWLLNNFSMLSLVAMVVGGILALSLVGSELAHRRWPSLAEGAHNDMVGVVLSVFGAIYGIILAFVVVTLWTQLEEAEAVVSTEASDLEQVVRNVRAFPPAERSQMEAAVSVYVHAVVERQWPLMRAGKAEHSVTQRQIDGIYAVLQAYEPDDGPRRAFYRESITHLNDVVAQRRARLTQSHQELPLLLQVLVYGGALVIIPLTFLYGNRSRKVRLLFVGAITALIGFSLLLVLVLDRPFAGGISVSPEPYAEGALARFW